MTYIGFIKQVKPISARSRTPSYWTNPKAEDYEISTTEKLILNVVSALIVTSLVASFIHGVYVVLHTIVKFLGAH